MGGPLEPLHVACTPHVVAPEVTVMSNINSRDKKLSDVELWIIHRLLERQKSITLLSLIREYAQERGVELQNAKRILLRRIKQLEQKGT